MHKKTGNPDNPVRGTLDRRKVHLNHLLSRGMLRVLATEELPIVDYLRVKSGMSHNAVTVNGKHGTRAVSVNYPAKKLLVPLKLLLRHTGYFRRDFLDV
jgi:hypothetical protein